MQFNSRMIVDSNFCIITGYDSKAELNKLLSMLVNNKECHYFPYFNIKLPTPTDEDIEDIDKIIKDLDVDYEEIKEVLEKYLPEDLSAIIPSLSNAIFSVTHAYAMMPDKDPATSRSLFIRIIKALSTTFLPTLYKDELMGTGIVVSGRMTKALTATLTILNKYGCRIILITEKTITPPIYIPMITFEGKIHNFDLLNLMYENVKEGVIIYNKSAVRVNDWANLPKVTDLQKFITKYYNQDRIVSNEYRTFNIGLLGVSAVENDYIQQLTNFKGAHSSHSILIDGSFLNPSYEETVYYRKYMPLKKETIIELLTPLTLIKSSNSIGNIADKILSVTENLSQNQQLTYFIWSMRIANKLLNPDRISNRLPVVIVYGEINTKVNNFLPILEVMPLDVLHFSPDYRFRSDHILEYIGIGETASTLAHPKLTHYPLKSTRVLKTVAYNAEQEVNDLLYTEDSGMFKFKQYKRFNIVRLQTTYEEANILWNTAYKFREGFNITNGEVTVPCLFLNIKGIKDTPQEYLDSVRENIVSDTILIQKRNPFANTINSQNMGKDFDDAIQKIEGPTDSSESQEFPFLATLWDGETLDKNRLLLSSSWKYNRYSKETTNLMLSKLEELLTSDWIKGLGTRYIPEVMYAVLNLPAVALNLLHSNDFTDKTPKIVVFSPDGTPLRFKESVQLVYLNSLGFDILIYNPTGYNIIENYVPEDYYDTVIIGKYNYNIDKEMLVEKAQNYTIRRKIV